MKASIEYLPQESYLASVEIEDIGNVALVMYNDMGQEWYLLTTTELGWTKIYLFGPLLPDINSLVIKSFSFSSPTSLLVHKINLLEPPNNLFIIKTACPVVGVYNIESGKFQQRHAGKRENDIGTRTV